MKIVNYNHLCVLAICVQTRNYTEAARILRRRQPTVSITIRTLAKALGDPLFHQRRRRGTRKGSPEMIPTPLAIELAQLMRPVVNRVATIEEEITTR
jgi:DNA-binding transcriptional LysR family regulator